MYASTQAYTTPSCTPNSRHTFSTFSLTFCRNFFCGLMLSGVSFSFRLFSFFCTDSYRCWQFLPLDSHFFFE